MDFKRLKELSGIISESYNVEWDETVNTQPQDEQTVIIDKEGVEKLAEDLYTHLVEVKTLLHEAEELTQAHEHLSSLSAQLIKDYKQFVDDVQHFISKAKIEV